MSDELTPITRKETFLAKAGGQNVVTPTPITREETFLQAIIDNGSGGGGGGGGGALVVHEDLDTGYLDKTWQEIFNALSAGVPAFIATGSIVTAGMVAISLASSLNGYFIYTTDLQNAFAEAETADSYPLDLDF